MLYELVVSNGHDYVHDRGYGSARDCGGRGGDGSSLPFHWVLRRRPSPISERHRCAAISSPHQPLADRHAAVV